jgi:hypothetical protein
MSKLLPWWLRGLKKDEEPRTPTGTRVQYRTSGTRVGPKPAMEPSNVEACDAFFDFGDPPTTRFCGRCVRCRESRGL